MAGLFAAPRERAPKRFLSGAHGTRMTRRTSLLGRTALHTVAAAALSASLLLPGCGSLPTSGPSNGEVLEQALSKDNPIGLRVVDLTPAVVQALKGRPERPLSTIDRLRSNRPVDLLGPGDVLAISIYEAGEGLFNTRRNPDQEGSSASTAERLTGIQVDRNGSIKIPYAGDIRVAGQTVTQVQRTIERRLSDRAAQPQVVVSLVLNGSNVVYLSGDVKAPGRFPLTLAKENLLDIIALAGGPTRSPQDTLVKVTRRGQEATTSLNTIQTVAEENIPVNPQDRIQVDYRPRTYLSFGATGRVSQIAFDAATVSLAEAVARVGGLDDNRANPEAVFLFRFERQNNAQTLGLVPTGTRREAAPVPGATPEGLPVIYKINLRDAQTFFAIQQFLMQDKDLVYIANAPTVQIYKFLQLIYSFATPALTARAVTQ